MKCERCKKYEDCSTGSGLVWPCGAYDPKFITNADKIRAMSDDELADFLHDINLCPFEYCGPICRPNKTRRECWNEWLRKPAEEE